MESPTFFRQVVGAFVATGSTLVLVAAGVTLGDFVVHPRPPRSEPAADPEPQ